MKSMRLRFLQLAVLIFAGACAPAVFAADPYNGPRPPKPDLPYLVHADNLVATEEADATQESKKDDTTYSIRGANSPARTPVPEPIFLLQSDKILPQRLELYKLEVKNGRREITVAGKSRRRGGPKPLHLTVTKIEGNLYRVEAGQPLDDGQYSLSPSDSNKVFCFEVY
jgi:hypothetical protein